MWLTKAIVKSNTIIIESSQTESATNDPCSCTSFSSSDIDDRVITELLAEQSRLYNVLSAKYSLPLKEEQMLEKNFKTRPLNEIFRSQLLSSSTSDGSKTVTDMKLKPPSVNHPKALPKAEKTNDVYTVEDKSAVSEMKELNESCSCCLCSLTTRLNECVQKGRRNRQAHIENIASRSSLASKQTNSETKNIKSDPCTCACKHKNIKECQGETCRQNFNIKQPDIRQRDRFLLPTNSKPLSINNGKQRNSYHKLKRCYFTPYMENIGEGGIKKTQKFTKLLRDNAANIKDLESMEKLKLLQQIIKDSFNPNNNALPKLSPEKRRIFQNTLNENNKNAFIESFITQLMDKSYLGHKQNTETVQKCGLKSGRYKRIDNGNDIHASNTATTSIRKTKNVTNLLTFATKQQKYPTSKLIKNNQPLVNLLQISNPIQKPTESNTSLFLMNRRYSMSLPSLLSMSSVTNMTSIQDKYFPLTQNARKRSSYIIKTNTSGIRVKILKSISTTSIDKKSQFGNVNLTNESPSLPPHNVNKITLKVNPLTSFHKMITQMQSNTTQCVVHKNLSPSLEKTTSELPKLDKRLNEDPLDQEKIPASQILGESNTFQVLNPYKNENLPEITSFHKKPISPKLKTDLQQLSKKKSDDKDNKSSTYALKKCVCNLRIKVIDIRSKMSKISAKQNKVKVKKSSKSKLQNPLKDSTNMSKLSVHEKLIKTQASKCEHSNSFTSLNIKSKRRSKRNPPYRHHFTKWSDFKLKNNLTYKKQTEQEMLDQNIPYATWNSSIPVSYNPNKNTADKELVISGIMNEDSKCKSYLSKYDSDKANNMNMFCESNTRLKTKSILKDASIGRDEEEIFQNQSVQTVNFRVLPFLPDQMEVLCEDKSTSDHGPIEVGTMSSKQGKSKSNTTKPILNMIFFNKGRGNYGLTITQSSVKAFYNKSARINLKNKLRKTQQEISSHTDETKGTPKKRGLRRFFDILKTSKIKNQKKERNQVKLSNKTINQNQVEAETLQTKVNAVYEVMKSVINPQKCNSDFCKPIKRDFRINKEKKSKKIIKNIVCKSNTKPSLTSQSANFPRTKNLTSNLSNKSELNIPVNKYASSARKFLNNLRFTPDVPFKRQDVINEKFFKNASKVLNTKNYTKSLHMPTLMHSKKQDRSKSFGPKIKLCLHMFKLHKRGKPNRKSCEVNTETQSKLMSEIINPYLLNGPMSTKSKNSKVMPYQSDRSKPFILLCMPRKCNPCTKNKRNSSKSFELHSMNAKTILNSISNRKLIVDSKKTKLLYVNKALCKQRCRSSKRKRNSRKQPELTQLSKKCFMPSVNSHKYKIWHENNDNQEQRIIKNNLNYVKNTQGHQTVSDRYSYSKNICTYSHMTSSSNKHLCTYKILENHERRCSKLFAPRTHVYTTNTVTFGRNKSKTPDTILKNTYCCATKEALQFKPKFKCKSKHVKNNWSKNSTVRSAQSPSNVFNQSAIKNQKSWINRKQSINPAQLTGVLPLVRRRYCTMNVQVAGRNVRRKHHYYSPRLESIPYQYQKCIMERFVGNVPNMSGTDRRLKFNPNPTPSVSSGSRTRRSLLKLNHKVKHHVTYRRPIVGFKYQTLPRSRQPFKHEESVGFTLGFHTDFSERASKAAHTRPVITVPKHQTTSRSSKTYDRYAKDSSRGDHAVGRYNRQSQSKMSQIFRRASNVSPMLRQCFCALKLQKKGRLQKAREMQSNQDKATKIIADEPVFKTMQNSKKHHYPELEPYEYESGICIPDDCDPAWLENKERLELRKRRCYQSKEFAADLITSHFSLTSDMIRNWDRRDKQMQFLKYNGYPRPVSSRHILVRPSEIMIEKSTIQRPRLNLEFIETESRINSRYSFNRENTNYINKRELRHFRKCAFTHRKMKHKLSRNVRQKRDSDSQTVLCKHGQSSGFLKRCLGALQFLTPTRNNRRENDNVGHERPLSTLDTNIINTQSTRAPKRIRRREHYPEEIILDEFPHHPHVQIAAIKRSHPKRYKSYGANCTKITTDRTSRETESFRNRDPQIDVPKTKNNILWPKLRQCFCKLKFHRQKPMSKKGTMSPYEEVTTLYNSQSVISLNKLRTLSSKLEHYECEPVFSLPGKCDPYKRENRIKRLDMCSSVTLTEGYLSKSNSRTECQHRFLDSKAQSVRQPQPMRTRKHQYEVRRTQYITNVVHTPSKRTSNIFRLDFFKDKPPDGGVIDFKPMKQHTTYKKPRRVPNKSTNIPVTYRNSKAQHERALDDKDSVVLAQKMRSKITGVGPYLKKCFCTLQLHKSPDRPFSFAMNVSQTVTKPKLEAFSTESATYTSKPYQFHIKPLGLNECEPGDSYRCEQRKILSKYSNTDPFRIRSKSSSMQIKTNCKRTKSGICWPTQKNVLTYQRGDGHSLHKNEYLREEPLLYDSGAYRPAVQVRSNFNFNIESLKNGSPQISAACDINKNIKKEMKGIGTRSTGTRSVSGCSNKSYIRDCQSQSECIKTGKASRASLLQRCFCRLKLQKMVKQQYAKTIIMPPTESLGIVAKKQIIVPGAREIGTKIKQKYPYILEPYECGLGVCVHGYCDPYDCRKRKKLKNMRHPGIGSSRITKSMSSVTSKDVDTKAMNAYLYKQKRDKRRTASTETIYRIKQPQQLFHENNNRCRSISKEPGSRINMDFMKDKKLEKGVSYKSEKPIKPNKYKSKGRIHNPNKMKSKGSVTQHSIHNKWAQAGVKRESTGTGMKPILKRCFGTLTTLQRLEFKNRLFLLTTNKDTYKDKAKVKTTDKTTSTKKKYSSKVDPLPQPPVPPPKHKIKRIDHYELRECKPGVCVPGECDPPECEERNKRRGIRRISRRRRSSQVSVSSITAQVVPHYKCKKTQHEEFCIPYNIDGKMDRIVEEPRFQFFRNNLQNPMRKGVKFSSNFKFNVEFYKETLPYTINRGVHEKAICYKDACVECKNPNKSKTGYTCATKHCRDQDCQSQTPTTKDKSFTVAMLKRCFCTAKFHRSQLSQSNRTQSKTVVHNKVDEKNRKTLFGPREYRVQYQMIQPTKRSNKMDPQEMKTSCKNSKHDYPADNEKNKLTFKKMFHRCNNLFKKQSNEKYIYNLNQQKKIFLVKPNHKLPLVDMLKFSKTERLYNKTKVDGKFNIIKKYFRFQSGDAAGQYKKDSGIKSILQVRPNTQVQLEQIVAVKKKVRFAAVCNNITNRLITSKQIEELKPVFFLFKNKNFKHNNRKFCCCCGRAKRKNNPNPANQDFKLKKIHSLRKAVTFNNPVVLTSKISKPVKETMALQEIRKRHKLSCPCCVCRKHKPNMARPMRRVNGKKDYSNVCGYTISKKKAETRIAIIHLEAIKSKRSKHDYETRICAAKTKKKVPALEYIYIRPPRKINKDKNYDEAKICDKIYKGKNLKKMCNKVANKKHVTNRMKKCKDTFGSLFVAKTMLGISKLGVPKVGPVLPLHRIVFFPRYIYHNFQSYLRGAIRVSKNLIKRTKDGPVAAILKRFKLRLHAAKFIFSPVKVDLVIITTESKADID